MYVYMYVYEVPPAIDDRSNNLNCCVLYDT